MYYNSESLSIRITVWHCYVNFVKKQIDVALGFAIDIVPLTLCSRLRLLHLMTPLKLTTHLHQLLTQPQQLCTL